MAERIWTPEQLEAITCQADDILVSAGAGSGKTAVLTERIIRRLSSTKSSANNSSDEPADITRMLIVTFTNAATTELRERVGLALREKIAADPGNRRLRRQLLLLPSAKIDTISSFCYNIVRSNLSALGLPAGLRVCDETESALLAAEVMDQVIDGFYDGGQDAAPSNAAEFALFCDAFVSDRDDKLAELFLELYRKVIGYKDGVGLLGANADALAQSAEGVNDFMTTPWGESIALELRSRLDYFIPVLERALDYFDGESVLIKAYQTQFAYDLEFARGLRALLSGERHYTALREYLIGYKPARLGSVRNLEPTAELDFYKKCRGEFALSSGFIKTAYKNYFSIDEPLLRSVLSQCAGQCRNFFAVLSAFDEKFSAEKRRRAVADYGDLERFAYKLLYDADGSISELARSAAADYDEIYIDEYQDVNELQDLIFTALTKAAPLSDDKNNIARKRFMVGDVKQSIYGFRGAAPSLFAGYRGDPAIKTLFLRSNFRCDGNIIGFVNRVSGHMFAGSGGEVEYCNDDNLLKGKSADGSGEKVKIMLFNSKNVIEQIEPEEEQSEPAEPENDEVTPGTDGDSVSEKYGEPEFVADEIARLIASGRYKPNDIAILLRNASGRAEVYEAALRSRSIGADGGAPDFFAQPEVLLMLSMFGCVNNPARDIPLAAVLRSPLYGFTFDDLIRVRRFVPQTAPDPDGLPFYLGDAETEDKTAFPAAGSAIENADTAERRIYKTYSFYDALKLYTEHTGFEKGKRFLEKLNIYREYAKNNPADRVVRYIYRDTAIMAVVAGGGGTKNEIAAKKRNLTRLYDLARTFENGQFRGLNNFLDFIEGLAGEGRTESAASGGDAGRVRIISIHKSKGLEFPVCFICDCARKFNDSDSTRLILFDPLLGAAAKLGDKSGFGRINTPVRTAAALRITRRGRYEEMRSLYVAMTRARERLYITATLLDPAELLDKTALTAEVLPSEARGADAVAKNNYISWITDALSGKSDNSAEIEIFSGTVSDASLSSSADDLGNEALHDVPIPDESEVARYKSLFEPRLAFKYRWKPFVGLPAKLSVSNLYPSILDENGDEDAFDLTATLAEGDKPETQKYGPPRFLSPDKDDVTAAERGTATHIFMQFCDFARVEAGGIREESARLITGEFMTAAHAKLVDVKAVERFFDSDLYADMRSARKLFREVRFNVRLPASEFTQNDELRELFESEPVLVQGVVDCYYESSDGKLRLVDYKTDFIPHELRSVPGKAEELLISRHSRQLGYYAQAIAIIAARPVESSAIYSFALGKAIYL